MRLTLASSALASFNPDALRARLREAADRWRALPPDAHRAAVVFCGIYAASWLAAMTAAVMTLSA